VTEGSTAARVPRRAGRISRSIWVTPEAVYGTLLTGVVLALAEENSSDGELLVNVASGSFVLWAAHVFATIVARHGAAHGRQALRAAAAHATHHSAGFLIGPSVSVLALYVLAVVAGLAVLVVLGTAAAIERRVRWYLSVLAGLATGAVGLAIIILEAVFH
jgi:hypothetical protein